METMEKGIIKLSDGRYLRENTPEGQQISPALCELLGDWRDENGPKLDPIRPLRFKSVGLDDDMAEIPVVSQEGDRSYALTDAHTLLLFSWRFGWPISVGEGRFFHASKVGMG